MDILWWQWILVYLACFGAPLMALLIGGTISNFLLDHYWFDEVLDLMLKAWPVVTVVFLTIATTLLILDITGVAF